jgi:hypothetical protein
LDSAITVAFEDVPEDGLDSPLRIEKLTNEVRMGDVISGRKRVWGLGGLSGSVLVGCEQISQKSAPIFICPYLEIEELSKNGFLFASKDRE